MSAPVPEPGPGTGRTRPGPPFGPMRAPQAAARGPLSTGRAGPDLVAPRAARDTTRRATRHEPGSAGPPGWYHPVFPRPRSRGTLGRRSEQLSAGGQNATLPLPAGAVKPGLTCANAYLRRSARLSGDDADHARNRGPRRVAHDTPKAHRPNE